MSKQSQEQAILEPSKKRSTEALRNWIKAHGAWNKGTRGVIKANSGSIKKGQFLGEKHPNWKGGIYEQGNGYIQIYSPNHPHKNKDGYVLEHRLVMEKHLKRYLTSKEVVHHINENPSDNRILNLMLVDDITHRRLHFPGHKIIEGIWWKLCKRCGQWKKILNDYYGEGRYVSSLCRKCHCLKRERSYE